MNRSRTAHLALLLGAIALVVPTALAQISTGTVSVETLDASSVALPGVTVVLENVDNGLTRTGVTDGAGLARFTELSPGPWFVSTSLPGFDPIEAGFAVRVGQTLRLRMELRPQMSEAITVTGDVPLVDVYRQDTATNIVPEQIQQLPVAERDFQKLAFIAPGVQRERGAFRFVQGGPVIGAGGNASQATVMVDGVDYTDQALGQARTRFSQDAVQEFRVINDRFDAEIGGSAGGALSVVTKSGTNTVSGSLFAFMRDDSLRSTGELEEGDQAFSREQIGFTVGGPISVDTTHYFVSAEYIDEDDITPFRPSGAFADQAADVAQPLEQFLGLAAIDHRFSDTATLEAKLVYESLEQENFRVGGIAAPSYGQTLERDNLNLNAANTWMLSDRKLNSLRVSLGTRKYFEPTNSDDLTEWFSSGNTLQIGKNIVGDLLGEGDYYELRDTFHWQINSSHDLKIGGNWTHIEERSIIDTFPGLMIYATDDRTAPLLYIYGVGSSDVTVDTDLFGVFVQDDWRVRSNFSLSAGLRWDYDTDGNNPDFSHSLTGDRDTDDDNWQPRLGFTWDPSNTGRTVLRGGAGLFTGRYLLVPSFTELQQNGESGRVTRQNLNGLFLGLPPNFWLDPTNPENTGVPLPPDITLLQDSLEAPTSTQVSLGLTQALGDTGLYATVDAIYVDGDDEIVIRDTNFDGVARINPAFNQINMYTNEGESEYKALILGLNGTLSGGHLLSASVTFADKENIADDFSPAFPSGYPSDPTNIAAEWGPSRSSEDYRIVLSGVFRAPWDLTVAPIYEYGSGQPWNRILGYDANGDGKNSDRAPGVGRNSEDGPSFSSFSLRLTKSFALGGRHEVDVIVEGFNLFNETNYDVTSVDNAEFLAQNLPNPNFGTYRATLDPRELQVGLRYRF